MKTYFEPLMNIASFDTEAVETTVSAALTDWEAGDSANRYTAQIDFAALEAVDVQF